MTPEAWFAFALASVVLVAIPGPTVTLVVSYGLSEGRRAAWATVAGVALGDLVAMTLSLAGLGTVLAASAALFTALKWAGAAYLIYLGVCLWRSEPSALDAMPAPARVSGRRMFGHAFVVTALNPKSIVFFIAFLPQFISPAAPLLPQMIALGATFLALATVNAAVYALLADRIRGAIKAPSVMRAVNRLGGGALIGAGILTAALRRPV